MSGRAVRRPGTKLSAPTQTDPGCTVPARIVIADPPRPQPYNILVSAKDGVETNIVVFARTSAPLNKCDRGIEGAEVANRIVPFTEMFSTACRSLQPPGSTRPRKRPQFMRARAFADSPRKHDSFAAMITAQRRKYMKLWVSQAMGLTLALGMGACDSGSKGGEAEANKVVVEGAAAGADGAAAGAAGAVAGANGAVVGADGARAAVGANGVIVDAEGNRVVVGPDGSVAAASADGSTAVVGADGKVTARAADGTSATVVTGKDGAKVVGSNGEVITTDKNGAKVGEGKDAIEANKDGVKVGGINVGADGNVDVPGLGSITSAGVGADDE